MICPLCASKQQEFLIPAFNRTFKKCSECKLIFADASFLPDEKKEKERYLKHENTLNNPGYFKFLESIIEPSLPYLKKGSRILDYGCGPYPALAELLEKEGFECDKYDPFFFPEEPKGNFDFIFSTETFEHFFNPKKELGKIAGLLNTGGFLAVMTEFYPRDLNVFCQWHYLRDFTHVSFYNLEVFHKIALMFGLEIVHTDNKRILLAFKR
jgi:SAM-dependent methyltransferase